MDTKKTLDRPSQVIVCNKQNTVLVEEIIRDIAKAGGLKEGKGTLILDMTYGEG